jgi:hypothetical protein
MPGKSSGGADANSARRALRRARCLGGFLPILPPHVLRRLDVEFELNARSTQPGFLHNRAEDFRVLLLSEASMRTGENA